MSEAIKKETASAAFLDGTRTAELWAAIKAHVAVKLEDYTTADAVAAAIAAALADYAKEEEVTKAITDALADYFTKTEVEAKIREALAEAAGGGMTMSVVDTLPETGMEKVIYLIPSETAAESNIKDEYLWVDGKWELIGSTAVDLEGYWAKAELRSMTIGELEEILV